MAGEAAREQFLREAPSEQAARVAASFARIAAGIEQQAPVHTVGTLLEETETFCEWASISSQGDTAALFGNLKQALATWRQVWPRMGSQQEFRQAVAREAAMWSKRLQGSSRGA